MNNSILEMYEKELMEIVNEYQVDMNIPPNQENYKLKNYDRLYELKTRCFAAVERATGREGIYFIQLETISNAMGNPLDKITSYLGVAKALLHDIKNGYLQTLEELVHGELFGDFLEMADHLVSTGYKDAAAVIAGSTLEAHLKQLCNKASISLLQASGKPKKADSLNSELKKANVYSPVDQKNVTAWLGLRNNAAHGEYSKYNKEQVVLLISGIRNFIARIPA